MRHNFPRELTTEIQKQQNKVRSVNLLRLPCPNCRHYLSLYEAAGMHDPKAMDRFDDEPIVRELSCSSCHIPLKQSVVFNPPVGTPWIWEKR